MIVEIIILTFIIEIITILSRMKFGSAKDNSKSKIRIHHSYIGVFLLILYALFFNEILLMIGVSLLFSDLIHHFLILPFWVGKTEFP